MIRFDFNKREYDHFVEYCGFTKDELDVFNLRRNGDSIIEIAQYLSKSEATINRIIKKIKQKIQYEIVKGSL